VTIFQSPLSAPGPLYSCNCKEKPTGINQRYGQGVTSVYQAFFALKGEQLGRQEKAQRQEIEEHGQKKRRQLK